MIRVLAPITQPQFEVEVDELETYSGPGSERSSLVYIHKSRVLEGSGYEYTLDSLRDQYLNDLPDHVRRFGRLLDGFVPAILIGAPSSKDQIVPFLELARQRFPGADNLTPFFHKTGSAGTATTFSDFLPHLSYTGPRLNDISGSVLIVDDSFGSGMTVAAMIERMITLGLPPSSTIRVRVPLRLLKRGTVRGGE
jgi:hypothetical protein